MRWGDSWTFRTRKMHYINFFDISVRNQQTQGNCTQSLAISLLSWASLISRKKKQVMKVCVSMCYIGQSTIKYKHLSDPGNILLEMWENRSFSFAVHHLWSYILFLKQWGHHIYLKPSATCRAILCWSVLVKLALSCCSKRSRDPLRANSITSIRGRIAAASRDTKLGWWRWQSTASSWKL